MKKFFLLILTIFAVISLSACEPTVQSDKNNEIVIPERGPRFQTITFTSEKDFNRYFTMSTSRTRDTFNRINQVTIQPRPNVRVESLNVSFTFYGQFNHTATCSGLTGGMLEQCRRPVNYRHVYVINSTGTTNFNVDRPSNFSRWVNQSYGNYAFTGRVTVPIED